MLSIRFAWLVRRFVCCSGIFDKKMMCEKSLRVPFMTRYPRAIAAGSHSTDLVTNCDYAPRLLELAVGLRPSPGPAGSGVFI